MTKRAELLGQEIAITQIYGIQQALSSSNTSQDEV
jgi:hypothetical protein